MPSECPACKSKMQELGNGTGWTVFRCESSRRFPQGNLIQSTKCLIAELRATVARLEGERDAAIERADGYKKKVGELREHLAQANRETEDAKHRLRYIRENGSEY